MAAVEPIREKSDVGAMAEALRSIDPKYELMYWMGVYTGLRVGDLLKLRVRDVAGKKSIRILEEKTKNKRKVQVTRTVVLNSHLRRILSDYCKGKRGVDFLVPARNSRPASKPAGRQQAWAMMKRAGEELGLDHIGSHSMRKTFGYFVYMENHKDVGLVQEMLQHSSPVTTLRYIGVNSLRIDDAYEDLVF